MKVVGYIESPLPVVDFLRTVYTDDVDLFISVSNNYKIEKFLPISPEVEVTAVTLLIYKELNDPELYFYSDPNENLIIGEANTISKKLKFFLNSKKINQYAKLSIAQFLNLKGKEKKIIATLREIEKNSMINLDYLFKESPYTNLLNNYEIDKISKRINLLITRTDSEDILDDLILIENDFIYIDGYKIDLSAFGDLIKDATKFFEKYFSEITLDKKENIRADNKYLFRLFFENKINLTLTTNEIKIMDRNTLTPYYIDNEISSARVSKQIYLSKANNSRKEQMKDLLDKFTIVTPC